jgi:hypothetical protein
VQSAGIATNAEDQAIRTGGMEERFSCDGHGSVELLRPQITTTHPTNNPPNWRGNQICRFTLRWDRALRP